MRHPFRQNLSRPACAAAAILLAATLTARAQTAPAQDERPLSPAQVELFETPHLRDLKQGETLDYAFVRQGANPFTDRVTMRVEQVNPDGTKDLSFDFLGGDRHMDYPELDNFRGNPLVMLVLERDVRDMKQTLGVSAAYFRNRIRQAFLDRATVSDTQFTMDGKTIPAKLVTVQPFSDDPRLGRLPTVQQKTYAFVLSEAVPGMVAEIRTAMPGDKAAQIPEAGETMTFKGVER